MIKKNGVFSWGRPAASAAARWGQRVLAEVWTERGTAVLLVAAKLLRKHVLFRYMYA